MAQAAQAAYAARGGRPPHAPLLQRPPFPPPHMMGAHHHLGPGERPAQQLPLAAKLVRFACVTPYWKTRTYTAVRAWLGSINYCPNP